MAPIAQKLNAIQSSRLSWSVPRLLAAACLLALRVAGDTTLVVRSDGTGNFTSIQAALDSCTPGSNPNLGRVTLLLRGLFFEAVEVYSNFTGGVDFVGTGAGPLEALIIDNRPGTVYSWLSATVKVDCNGARGQRTRNCASLSGPVFSFGCCRFLRDERRVCQ